MYPITNDLLTRFQNGDKQYVRMTMGSTVIDGSDIMQGSFSINRYVETNESVAVGSVVAAELTCVLNNYDGTYDNTSFIGSEAYVEVGVENSNHVVQYIPMGYFIFDEATRTKNTISLAALDRMAKFDDPIVASSFSFPYTLTNLLSRICTLCSVTKGTFTLTNSSYSVAELPEETKTYRDLLRWICEVSGSNGYISYDGKLYLGWYGTTSQFNILPSNRTQSELDPNTFTITGVTILTGDNNKYTAGTNTRPITITNNPLINTTTAQSVANTLNTKLNGFSYTPFNAVMLPSPMIYPMDRATFTTAEGTTVAVSVTEVTFKLNGNTAIACKGEMTVKGRAYGLADQTFYASNIAAGSITADKIAAGAITADKIQTGAVTSDAINSSVDMATNAGVASTYATKSDAIKREQRLYRRTSTTSTPSTPTSWITTSTDVNNAWTTKPIAYNTTYKYLWVCWQRETVSGTLSCTTPVRDATITVIDGGNILTGTVTADQISVTDLESLQATIAGWNIGTDALYKDFTVGNQTYRTSLNTASDESPISVDRGNQNVFSVSKNGAVYVGSPYGDLSARISAGAEVSLTDNSVTADRRGSKLTPTSLEYDEDADGAYRYANPTTGQYEWADRLLDTEYSSDKLSIRDKISKSDGSVVYEDNTVILTPKDLTFSNNSLIRLTPHLAQVWSKEIIGGNNLNTTTFLKVGQYFCPTDAATSLVVNCPTIHAFTMTVEAPIHAAYDNESSSTYVYRIRKILSYAGEQYVQSVSSSTTAGSFTYGAWETIAYGSKYVSKSGDTMTGSLAVSNAQIGISQAQSMRYVYVQSKSGFADYILMDTDGSHGVYSDGYGTSLTDATQKTLSGQWLVKRSPNGTICMPAFANKGNATTPVYFNADGVPVAGWQYVPRYNKDKQAAVAANTYIKIAINSAAAWMLSFTVNIYSNYQMEQIRISGYNYGQAYWYAPNATYESSSHKINSEVKFGYDGVNQLWVAIPVSNYYGVNITDVVNGYYQAGLSGLFTITEVTSLSGTTQVTRYAGVISSAGTASSTYINSGSATYVRDGDIVSVSINGIKTKGTPNNGKVLFTGLPAAVQTTYFICQSNATTSYRHAVLYVDTSGQIVVGCDLVDTSLTFYGSVTYIASGRSYA